MYYNRMLFFGMATFGLAACSTISANPQIEPSSNIEGVLFERNNCFWIRLISGAEREIEQSTRAKIVSSNLGMQFVGTDRKVHNFGTSGYFIAGEIDKKGQCSDENIIAIYRRVDQ